MNTNSTFAMSCKMAAADHVKRQIVRGLGLSGGFNATQIESYQRYPHYNNVIVQRYVKLTGNNKLKTNGDT